MFVDEYNKDGGYFDKYLLHTNRLHFHIKGKSSLIRSGYSVEVSGYDENNVIW